MAQHLRSRPHLPKPTPQTLFTSRGAAAGKMPKFGTAPFLAAFNKHNNRQRNKQS